MTMNNTTTKPIWLGYYNAHDFPIAFSRRGDGSAVMIDPGSPAVDQNGFLAPFPTQELEDQVVAGTLTRIRVNHPKFKDWDKLAGQRKTGLRIPMNHRGEPQDDSEENKVSTRPMKPQEEARASISSKTGISLDNDAAQDRLAERKGSNQKTLRELITELPDDVEVNADGTFGHNGEKFGDAETGVGGVFHHGHQATVVGTRVTRRSSSPLVVLV
jgi:hypothetical protein